MGKERFFSRFPQEGCGDVHTIVHNKWVTNVAGELHRWELPVLHYHYIMVIYPYPFLVVITQLLS